MSTATGNTAAGAARQGKPHGATCLWVVGALAALLLAGVVSFYASADPDGLEKVAADHGIDRTVEKHAAEDSPLADYQTEDIDNPRLSGGLAGVLGVVVTLAMGTGVFGVIRRRTPVDPSGVPGPSEAPASPRHI